MNSFIQLYKYSLRNIFRSEQIPLNFMFYITLIYKINWKIYMENIHAPFGLEYFLSTAVAHTNQVLYWGIP